MSSDGLTVEVDRNVAIMSKTVQDMIEGMLRLYALQSR